MASPWIDCSQSTSTYLLFRQFKTAGSQLCLVYGLENCVDLFSSVVVVWRFFIPGNLTKELEEHLQKREERASMAISFILVLLGVFVMGGALDALANGSEDETDMSLVLAISFISIFVFGLMTAFKFQYSKKLDSPSLHKDGLCSLLGTILSTALFVNTLIIESFPATWYLDPVVSLLCGLAAAVLGIHAIYSAKKSGLPVFSAQWWMLSQGSGNKETELADTAEGGKDPNNLSGIV